MKKNLTNQLRKFFKIDLMPHYRPYDQLQIKRALVAET